MFAGESVFLKSQSNYMAYQANAAAQRLRTRLMHSAASLAILLCAAPAMAQSATADEQARIEALEQQLQQVLGVVQSLSQELKALKSSQSEPGNAAPGDAPAQNLSADTLSPIDLSKRLDEVTASVAETNARLDDVEDIAFDIDERVGSRALVRAFDAKSFDLGGMLHTAATFVDGQNNDEFAVNRLTFELFAKAELNDKWSLFVAQAFIRESNINFIDPGARLDPNFNIGSSSPLVIATATYKANDKFVLDMGRFITPHGIVNIEHFPAILLDPEQPQFLRPFGGQTIFANFLNGAKASGQFYKPFGIDGTFGYAAYAGTFTGNSDSVNYGGRAFWSFADTGITLGANVGGGRRDGSDSDYVLYGADLLYDKGMILWKNELFVTSEDQGGDRLAFYSQPGLRFGDSWTAFYRFDFLDDGTEAGDRKEHSIGFTFKPIPQVHLRAIARLNRFDAGTGLTGNDFPSANAENYQLSATFSF
ncbi:hypothetical protein JCM17846_27950 [Iodidimonas nitroreducens]|uniref:Porin n=2 Tax=Iodidimonas nitroreducens TaxID=1236968 RepID=A0A5A7N9S4_9PROT|nr:hypothetical protein JCM17846_27950 [Iodidimonas nitroreducens]